MTTRDDRIARLARRQHGVVAYQQLIALGLSRKAIRHRRATGRLVELYPGVYAVGHRELRLEGRWLAAALAYGDGAVLSHETALGVWGLRDAPVLPVNVTVPTGAGIVQRPGTRLFRRAGLNRSQCARRRGLPVTRVPRTLVDAASVLEDHALRRATEQAIRLHRLSLDGLRACLDAHPGRAGTPALRIIVDDFAAHGVTFTRSELEAMALQLFLREGVARPEVNRVNGGREIDCRWPGHGLVVEIDGYESHRTATRFVADRQRDRDHLLRGEVVLAYTHHDLTSRPGVMAAEIRTMLGRLSS